MLTRTAIVAVLALGTTVADAAPKRPASPGNPPKLAGVPADGVVLVVKDKTIPVEVWLEGHDTWKLELRGAETTGAIVLPKLEVGTQRGDKARLGTGTAPGREGPWTVEITAASVGYLKSPGTCRGKIAAWFAKDVYVVGTFEAGCISYKPPR